MSALAKPMVHSSRATGSEQPINAEKIVAFEAITVPPVPNKSKADYKIVFTMETGSAPKDITWVYADQADMDADFAAVLGLISEVTP